MPVPWCGACVSPISPALLYWLWFPLNSFSCRWQRDRDSIDTTFLLAALLGSKRLWISPPTEKDFISAMTSLGSENLCRQAEGWKVAISHSLAHWRTWSVWISCPNWFACILWVFLKMCLGLVFCCLLYSCSPPTRGWQKLAVNRHIFGRWLHQFHSGSCWALGFSFQTGLIGIFWRWT